MKRSLYLLLLACLLAESSGVFSGYWTTPLRYLSLFLFEDKPLVAPFVDLFVLGLLVSSKWDKQPNPIVRAVYVTLGALAGSVLWGLSRGGLAYQVQFQIHAFVLCCLCVLMIRNVLQTPGDYFGLGKVLVFAAGYRALLCVIFYLFVLRQNLINPPPEFCTSHDDTVLFVSALVFCLAYAFTHPSWRNVRNAAAIALLLLAGIQFNNRRLAWVSLIAALIVLYAALPSGALRSKINYYALRVVPVIGLYVAIGWGRPEPIFKPLRSLSTVGAGKEDASTKSRDAENMGLLVTLTTNPALGTGWGHKYIEVDDMLSARVFLQYRYIPHNSVLGMLAFTGFLGFIGTWMALPVCAFLGAYIVYHTRDGTLRLLGIGVLTIVTVCMNQLWGDMGLVSYTTQLVLATGLACGSHLMRWNSMSAVRTVPPPQRSAPPRALGWNMKSARPRSRRDSSQTG